MEINNEIIETEHVEKTYDVEEQKIMSLNKFIFLSIISFGIYQIWWIYKSWRFYQQKEKLDIMPAARAIFSILFIHSLFTKILDFAKEKGYNETYSPTTLFIGFIVVNLLSRLPDPFWLISLSSIVCLIQPFNALNYAKQNSTDFIVTEETSFSGKQIALIVIGVILWALVIVGLNMNEV